MRGEVGVGAEHDAGIANAADGGCSLAQGVEHGAAAAMGVGADGVHQCVGGVRASRTVHPAADRDDRLDDVALRIGGGLEAVDPDVRTHGLA
ncbi:hypothetical protein D9M68_969200 [compost metagenome]